MINGSKSSARAVARRLRPSLPTRRASSKCAVGEFLLPPQTPPRAFDATIAALTLRDELGLLLGDRRENMDCESICLREIGGDEFDAAFHELRDQSDVAGEAVKLRDHQDRAGCDKASAPR